MSRRRKQYEEWCGIVAAILIAVLFLMILISWLISSAMPNTHVRSLLNSDGIRWFLGHLIDHICSPVLVWIILLTISYGTLKSSGFMDAMLRVLRGDGKILFRERFSLWITVIEAAVIIAIYVPLVTFPHPILLSSTGELFPSPFSRSIIPVAAMTIVFTSLSFGVISRQIQSFSSAIHIMTSAFSSVSPIIVLYLIATILLHTVCYIFIV